MNFAVIVLLGAGEGEIERTADLFDSMSANEPARVRECDVYVVSERFGYPAELVSSTLSFAHRYHVPNPRGEDLRHPLDHMTAGMLRGLSEIGRRGPYSFVLKLDTDALVVGPFHDQLAALFAARPRVGMAGSYLRFPDGSSRPGLVSWSPRVRSAMRLISFRRTLTGFRGVPAALRGAVRRRRLLGEAHRRGYVDGHHVLGGSYALSGKLVHGWPNGSLEALQPLFPRTQLSEDVVMSVLVVRAGYELIDYNAPGEVFGIWHRGLGDSPQSLLERYAIVHSLKSGAGQDEEGLRDLFRSYRKQGGRRTRRDARAL